MPEVDVYPVGWLARLRMAWAMARSGRWRAAHCELAAEWRYCVARARVGNWRAVRMTFNGWMAEPTPFPEGLRRCGSGWTKARARRRLDRMMTAAAAGQAAGAAFRRAYYDRFPIESTAHLEADADQTAAYRDEPDWQR